MKVKKDRVKIITLGCSKNLVDSEHILAHLQANDIEIVTDDKKTDIVIINTCGFIESAKEESINTILAAVENKVRGKIKKVFVAGCLSDRYMKELKKDIPDVDKYFGSTNKSETLIGILKSLGLDYKKHLVGERSLITPKHSAYLKISEGCDNPCSFCAIPIMRGKHVSKSLENIIDEANKLADKGVKEVMIIGQDTTYWGMDLKKNRRISDVINAISNIRGIEWIRLMYAYPSRFPEDLLDTIKNNNKVCKYIDIPIQHISDNVLKAMRRGITKKHQIHLLERLRYEIPELAIRTTLLVGHPGETEKDFEELLSFIKDFKFNRLGVFTYSHEDDTHAATLKDDIPFREKFRRQKTILEAQQKISRSYNFQYISRVFKVLIDRKENNYLVGRTYMDAPEIDQEVYIPDFGDGNPGEFHNVLINDFEEFDLFGTII